MDRARGALAAARHPKDLIRLATTGRWPRLEMALKAAAAALIAWQVALWLPFAPAEQYPYYAPLGAVIAAYTNVRSSVTSSVGAVLAVLAGAGLAVAAGELITADLVLVPLVVGIGVLLAGLRIFDGQSNWVPIAALFVLVVGAQDPGTYILAYAGLTLLGAAVAVLLNLVLPTVPIAQSSRAMRHLAATLADQLDDLAGGLSLEEPPSSPAWQERLQSIEPVLASVRSTKSQTSSSLSANARARREHGVVERQRNAAVVLETVATRTADLSDLILDVRAVGETGVDVEAPLRAPTARALRAAAAAVRPLGHEDSPRAPEVGLLRQRLRELSEAAAAQDMPDYRGREMAGAVTTGLRRLLGALATGLEEEQERRRVEQDAVPPTS
ncbi:aromatic acid exporter family protein [Kineococcus sp. SYSU DK004]|uniref:hypothetical protein n=1 Tax=Kineococcus sp. SYSU DK004 TaxID=3383125 RepID=UPI003D7D052A